MKRFTIFAVLLLIVGVSTGFALDLKPSVTLEGNETMTLGYDLNTGAIGFANSTDATLKVYLVSDDSSDTHKGTGAIYGSITISDFDLYWVDGKLNYNNDKNMVVPTITALPVVGVDINPATGLVYTQDEVNLIIAANEAALAADRYPEVNPDVSATLFIPPFSIGLDAPGMTADVVTEIEANSDFNDFSNIVLDSIVDNEDAADFVPGYSGNGTSLRYTDPGNMFWVQADVKTKLGYAGVDPNAQGLAIGAEGSVTIAPVTFGLGVFQGWGYTLNPLAFYVSSKLTLEGIGTASVGFDGQYLSTATTPFWGSFFASAQMNFNKEATSFLLLKALYETAFGTTQNHFDGYVDFEIPADTLIGPLSVSVLGYFLDVLTADIEYAAKANVGYTVWKEGDMYVKPMVTFSYGKANALRTIDASIIAANTDSIMAINPAVEVGLAANPLSTVTVGWSSGNLLRTGAAGANLGAITMAIKITY